MPSLFTNSPVTQDMIREELKSAGNDKAKLMQQYFERQNEILKEFAGTAADLPLDGNSEYNQIQMKKRVLNDMEVPRTGLAKKQEAPAEEKMRAIQKEAKK